MGTLLLKAPERVVTQDVDQRELSGVDVLVEEDGIAAIGPDLEAPSGARVLDCRGCVVMPGLINTHHHLFQTLTRGVPGGADEKLFEWLVFHYETWRHHNTESVRAGAFTGLAELLLTGCTSAADHHYLFPEGSDPHLLDHTIEAARTLGIRFHPTRGSMSVGVSGGGLAPDDICQDEDTILEDCERVIAAHHDPSPRSMLRVGLAPCAPFSVSPRLMRETAELARKHELLLHTHLCETLDEEEYCLRVHGKRPYEFMDDVGWVGDDVWYAHGIHFSDDEIRAMGENGTGIAHCPTSNMRLASGTAPIAKLMAADVRVGLGVDGSASNDASDMLGEARNCLLAHRHVGTADAMTARTALRLATWGGARILRRTDQLGSLEPGKAADLAVFRVDGLSFTGTTTDPVAGVLFTGISHRAWYTIVNGRVVVDQGRLVTADEAALAREGHAQARGLAERAGLV